MIYVNLIIINVIIWVALSYFWSFWTHKVFKPWAWLELKKRKLIDEEVMKRERVFKDRVRYYSYFFAMEQVERTEVPGSFVMAGVEEADLVALLRRQCPEREMWAIGPMAATEVTLEHENCQGEISTEPVAVDFVAEEEVRRLMPEDGRNHVVKGRVADLIGQVESAVALAMIDCVEHDTVLQSLRTLYPLMSRGGIIIIHSYNHSWDGVRKAVDTFCAGIPEGIVPLPDMYGSVAIAIGRKAE